MQEFLQSSVCSQSPLPDANLAWDSDAMPWPKPLNNPARIAAAGKIIAGRKQPTPEIDFDTALNVAGNWRSAHGYPLHVFRTLLRNRAKRIDERALVSHRLKRLPSIVRKLQRFHSMQLSTMQDLGGCRAVVRRASNVDRLVKVYEDFPTEVARFVGKKDYIALPKPDGYRSVHLVYEYQGTSQGGVFNGLKIEIQIRSRLQHAWATALETIDMFTDDELKLGLGSQDWQRFFALVGTIIAMEEKRPLVPNTPTDKKGICAELKPLCQKLRVPDIFVGLSAGLDVTAKRSKRRDRDVVAYILELNSEEKSTRAVGYFVTEDATNDYLKLEKANVDKPHLQTVLVSVDSLAALRAAYPSYYLDTWQFTRIIEEFMNEDAPQRTRVRAIHKRNAQDHASLKAGDESAQSSGEEEF
jgi:hypothetical protein